MWQYKRKVTFAVSFFHWECFNILQYLQISAACVDRMNNKNRMDNKNGYCIIDNYILQVIFSVKVSAFSISSRAAQGVDSRGTCIGGVWGSNHRGFSLSCRMLQKENRFSIKKCIASNVSFFIILSTDKNVQIIPPISTFSYLETVFES